MEYFVPIIVPTLITISGISAYHSYVQYKLKQYEEQQRDKLIKCYLVAVKLLAMYLNKMNLATSGGEMIKLLLASNSFGNTEDICSDTTLELIVLIIKELIDNYKDSSPAFAYEEHVIDCPMSKYNQSKYQSSKYMPTKYNSHYEYNSHCVTPTKHNTNSIGPLNAKDFLEKLTETKNAESAGDTEIDLTSCDIDSVDTGCFELDIKI